MIEACQSRDGYAAWERTIGVGRTSQQKRSKVKSYTAERARLLGKPSMSASRKEAGFAYKNISAVVETSSVCGLLEKWRSPADGPSKLGICESVIRVDGGCVSFTA